MPIDAEAGTMVGAASAAFAVYFMTVKLTFNLPSKRLAWVLPVASSIILAVLSLWELKRLSDVDWDLSKVAFTDSSVSRLGACIFLASLIVDCGFGALFYLDQFDLLSGWIHHTLYIFMTLYALYGGFTAGVIIFMANELPTFILALGHVMPSMRSDIGFGASFFATRILLHGWLMGKTFFFTNPPYEVRWCVAMPMIMHVWWFHAWVNGQMRRMKKAADHTTAKDKNLTVQLQRQPSKGA